MAAMDPRWAAVTRLSALVVLVALGATLQRAMAVLAVLAVSVTGMATTALVVPGVVAEML